MEYLASLASFLPTGDKLFLYSSIGVCVLSILVYEALKQHRRRRGALADGRPGGSTCAEKPAAAPRHGNPPREFGHWIPLDFRRPAARPFPGWSFADTKPLPYRPFKWGAYHVTMGIRSMPWDEWIELDNRFAEYQGIRAARLAERGARVCRTAPEALPATLELLEQLAAYLPQRYPGLYRQTEAGLLENIATGERFDIHERPLAEDPMAMASRLVQDDLAIMIEREDGQYYFLAGAILIAGFWRLEDKFGKSIREIHGSGRGVPEFRTKLQKGMENFFRRVTPDKPVVRFNYAIQADDDLAWSRSLGDENCPDESDFGWFAAEKNRAIEHHYFRSERQTLMRLPRTGGVVFTIRTYFEKVTDICQEPGVAGRLASAIRGWGEDVSRYKGKEWYVDVVLEYLDRKHAEQKAEGLVEDTEEHNLFPF